MLLEILEEEETQGGKKSFDLGYLFDEVIPKFLAAQGTHASLPCESLDR